LKKALATSKTPSAAWFLPPKNICFASGLENSQHKKGRGLFPLTPASSRVSSSEREVVFVYHPGTKRGSNMQLTSIKTKLNPANAYSPQAFHTYSAVVQSTQKTLIGR
jgi:hypothetical protein